MALCRTASKSEGDLLEFKETGEETQNLPLNKIIEALTINPAKILKINKGSLSKGSDGDICIFDLETPWKVDANKLKSKSKNTAIEGRNLQGKVLMTYLNGQLAFKQ